MTDGFAAPVRGRFFMTDWLAGAARAQRWMWSEAWCKWSGRALPSQRHAAALGAGQRFPLRRGSWMGVLVPMVVFSQFVDVLIAQGCLHIVTPPGAPRLLAHAALLFVSLWMVVWAVALRSAMRNVDHVLGPHAFTLAIGFKQLCRVPLSAIEDVRAIDHRAARQGRDWFDVHQLKPRDVSVVSALDPPTLLIALRPGANGAWWTRNGLRRPLRRWIAVYVDQPEAMRSAIAAALSASAPHSRSNRDLTPPTARPRGHA